MVRRVMQIGLAFAFALVSLADDASFKKTKLQTLEKGKQKFIDVALRVGDDKIVIVEKKSTVQAEIPYSQTKNISYEYAKRRRVAEGAVIMAASLGAGAIVMLTKSKSHWLTIEHGEGAETKETVLRLDKDEYGPAIAALEAKSGRQVVILTDKESKVNPTAGSENLEEVVPYSVDQVRAALKPAMKKYGCEVTEAKGAELVCKRGRGQNEAQGAGGEKITAKLTTEGSSTRVKIETGKGFVGRLAKKNWSTPIFQEMKKNLGSPSASLK